MKQQIAGYRDIFEKATNFDRAKLSREEGWYPFFKEFTGYEECASPAEIRMGDRRILMFGSNNYLGLTLHPKVKEAAIEAIRQYGTGCSGSRMLNGTLHLHNQLEAELADFMRQEAALLFGTGFQTNHGALSALAAKGDVLLADRQVHASLVDGMLTSRAKSMRFRHNDMDHLAQLLKDCDPEAGRLIVVDGVYSMEGDTADLPGIVELARSYGARIYLDDAHGIGVLGEYGRGAAEHYGVEEEIDVYAGTFSKSFACAGGFIAGDESVIEYVKHHSRAFIYSASMPPASLATVRAALEIIRTEPQRRDHLLRISGICRSELQRAGFEVFDGFTPVVAVVVDDEMLVCVFTNELLEEGVYVNPVLVPAAAKCLLRLSCMAVHTEEHIARLVEAMDRVGRRLGVVRGGV
ncbi:MAG: aminotransferase class I/II-fold pyridoxal phosphate-dependent enzyme [Planctomycetes bacterium]|nr:aminotransferase class I/II-fold pyridoxal phosphate-dependent enzyme [Planctomycetota bacterium]